MKIIIQDDFVLRSTSESAVVVAVGNSVETFLSMLKLNPSAEMLFRVLQEGATREELTQKLCDTFNVDEATARKDADAFADKLLALGVAREI